MTAAWLSYHLEIFLVRFLDFFFSEKYCVPVLFYAGKILAIHSKKRKRFSIFFCESTAARVRGGISISHFLVFGCEYSQEEMRFGGRNLVTYEFHHGIISQAMKSSHSVKTKEHTSRRLAVRQCFIVSFWRLRDLFFPTTENTSTT